jgi:cytochrome c peroxidase
MFRPLPDAVSRLFDGICEMRRAIAAVIVAGLAVSACDKPKPAEGPGAAKTAVAAEPLMVSAREQFKPIPAAAPVLPGNAATPEKLALGQMLFFDPRLSESHAISCASCHNIGLGGTDNQATSIGHHWQRGGRNAPTVLNAVFNSAQFWDGRAADLQAQAGGPMENPVEMASPKGHVPEQLRGIPGYREAFARAFPGETDPVTLANAERAIAVFEATLLTPDSPFDRYLNGDAKALTVEQKQGLQLFIDKGCAACHNGINVGGGMYAKFGVVADPGAEMRPPGDKGRAKVTGVTDDDYSFKVPTLRNIALTAPYFHTGSVWDLRQAVEVMGKAQLGAELTPVEVDHITAFLGSLTGKQPAMSVPILPAGDAKTPRPQP